MIGTGAYASGLLRRNEAGLAAVTGGMDDDPLAGEAMPGATQDFEDWLARWQDAWQRRDLDAAEALFTADVRYWWTPFRPVLEGRAQVRQAWAEATGRQRDVRVEWRVLAVTGHTGIAWWRTRFVRPESDREVTIDGVLVAELRDQLCATFREWWHSSELEA